MNDLFSIYGVAICNETFAKIVNLEIAIALGILGISITIFTVIYSFIENRLEDKKEIERYLKIAITQDLYRHAELKFVREYIQRNKLLNRFFVWLIFLSFFYILLLVVNLVYKDLILFIINQVLSIFYFLFFVASIMYYLYSYIKRMT